MKETELAAAVVAWLLAEGFAVYQEIEVAGAILDIAAVRRPVVWAIECKVRLNYEVMAQAHRWVPHVHRSLVAVPCLYGPHPYDQHLLEHLGLGLIDAHEVDHEVTGSQRSWHGFVVRHRIDGRLNARCDGRIARALREEHKTWAPAGQSGGSRWTPWNATCKDLREFVKANPGCSMKAAIDGIRHHYRTASTARSAMARWIKLERVGGVRSEVENGAIRLWPVPIPKVLSPASDEETA
jgi:hypothetical protein